MRQLIRHLYITFLNLDVTQGITMMIDCFNLALILMQQRYRAYQGQVLHVVTPCAGLVINKR